jgi:hypothetical protein
MPAPAGRVSSGCGRSLLHLSIMTVACEAQRNEKSPLRRGPFSRVATAAQRLRRFTFRAPMAPQTAERKA